jgi:LPS-assembly protein
MLLGPAHAQFNPKSYSPQEGKPQVVEPNQTLNVLRRGAPDPDITVVTAVNQQVEGKKRRLRGAARVETVELLLTADEIDYDEQTGDSEARGNVYFKNFESGEEMRCDRAEYNVQTQTGRFYNPKGSSPAKLDARPGVLTSPNPFSWEGRWAERLKDKYILHDGFVTSCKLPNPWWKLRGRQFTIVPGRFASARDSVYVLRGVPVFYFPYFFKSIEKRPRKSGFMMPKFGTSTRRGFMFGGGYYWAINRSYDLLYNGIYFTERGLAHNIDFRGKPNERSDFNLYIWGINDRGRKLDDGTRFKEGGYFLNFNGRTELGRGWYGRGEINYLSSFLFRQAFTETFNEAIFSEANSVGYVAKQWNTYSFHAVFSRKVNYQSTEPDDRIVIRRLPSFEFMSRDKQVTKSLPIWVSLESSAGFVRRNQPLFETRQFVERLDAFPHATTRLRWKDFTLVPGFGVRGTYWGSSQPERAGEVTGQNVSRFAREVTLDLIPPALERVYEAPRWIGSKLKHVIEPRANFRWVDGVADFNRIIRFDELELMNNTREAEVSLANRFYSKRADGTVYEFLSWTVFQRRYFDPTFGGALREGQRNVIQSQTSATGYTFLDGPRNYSPVVSVLRMTPLPSLDVDWRADYDPLRGRFTNSTVAVQGRIDEVLLSVGHTQVRSANELSPPANQLTVLAGYGRENRRGWSTAGFLVYDYRLQQLQFINSQVTYNVDCCGLSVQFRRFGFGTRNENQFRVAFVIANIGSFGTLRKQERFF